jgi:NAD(P)-dependent dehydrogenase (short-subunit alcohol dehydrogenase family)
VTSGIEGRVVAITGGGSGMGRAIALDLASHGARVAVCGRRAEPLEATVALVEEAGGEALAVPTDVRDPTQVDAFFDAVGERFGPADTLVNNAAGNFVSPALDLSPNGWLAVVNIVLNGTFFCSRAFARRFAEASRPTGSILSIIATYAWTGNPGTAHSAAAKAGVLNLTRTLAVEWAPLGLRVNCIAPGVTNTEGAAANLFPTEDIRQRMTAEIPLGRFAELDDIVRCARFMLSDDAAYVTGECLTLDGGAVLEQGMFRFTPPPAR